MRRARWLCLAPALLGCQPGAPIWLPREGAQSAIVVTFRESGATAISHVLGPDRGLTIELDDSIQSVVTLELDQALAELGLPEGQLHPDDALGAPLPPGDRIHRLWTDNPVWERLEKAPDEVTALRFVEARPCSRFHEEQRHLPASSSGQVTVVLELDPDRLLVVNEDGFFYEVTTDSDRLLPQFAPGTPHDFGTRAGTEIWLGTRVGKTVRGDLERGFVVGPTLPTDVGRWIDIAAAPDGLELYAVSSSLAIARSDGGEWTVIKQGTIQPGSEARFRIAWAEPGRVVVIGGANREALIVDSTGEAITIDLEVPERVAQDSPYSVQRIEGLGVVIGSHFDVMFLVRNDRSERLASAGIEPGAEVIIDLGDRSFLGGGRGELAHWVDGYGVCDPVLFSVAGMFNGAGRVGDRIALFSNASGATLMNLLQRGPAPKVVR